MNLKRLELFAYEVDLKLMQDFDSLPIKSKVLHAEKFSISVKDAKVVAPYWKLFPKGNEPSYHMNFIQQTSEINDIFFAGFPVKETTFYE